MAGGWSYSLYWMHMPTITILSNLRIPSFGYTVDWLLLQAFIPAWRICFTV